MYRKIGLIGLLFFSVQPRLHSQDLPDSINADDAAAIISVLASDSLKGRGNGTVELLQAATFIGEKFKTAGLSPLPGMTGFYIPFRTSDKPRERVPGILEWNGKVIAPGQFMYLHPEPGLFASRELADFSVIKIDTGFTADILSGYRNVSGPLLLWTSHLQPDGENFFPELVKIPPGGLQQSYLLVYSATPPDSLTLTALPGYYASLEYNVVGILPGRSRPGEVVLFSAHYDHIGISSGSKKDSIMNGANDDASGVTALLLLADHFTRKGNNERTLLFCAFAGEELGLLGSSDFIRYINPETIVAGINMEMIGVPQYGKSSVFITGQRESALPDLLAKGLKTAQIRTKREPSEEKLLFQRSDNYSFFKKGIPAHTIMSSDDDEPCYHRPCDEVKRIDTEHLVRVTRGIAIATEPLIDGRETPKRGRKINLP